MPGFDVHTLPANLKMVIRLLVFIGFYATALLAVLFSDRKYVKPAFLWLFFLGVFIPGAIIGASTLPFMDFGLYSNPIETETTGVEWRVVDQDRDELLYDYDALELSSATPMSRFASSYSTSADSAGEYWVAGNESEERQLACFLLQRANEHANEVARGPTTLDMIAEYINFPAHEHSYSWTAEDISGRTFESIRVYRVYYTFTEDSTELQQTDAEVIAEYECS